MIGQPGSPRCGICGVVLRGSYLQDTWGTQICPSHRADCPPCRFCGRLVPARALAAAGRLGGESRCPLCRSHAIDGMTQARPLFQDLVGWLNREGLRYGNLGLRVELRDQIANIGGAVGTGGVLGVTIEHTQQFGGLIQQRRVETVAVLRGIPSPLFQGVAAHELGHVWLSVHGVRPLPAEAEEGFCELLAHRRHLALGQQPYARMIEANPEPIYGGGYRLASALSAKLGFATLLAQLQRTHAWPRT